MILEDYGYKLTENQCDLTITQELFLLYGIEWLNKEKEKKSKDTLKKYK